MGLIHVSKELYLLVKNQQESAALLRYRIIQELYHLWPAANKQSRNN